MWLTKKRYNMDMANLQWSLDRLAHHVDCIHGKHRWAVVDTSMPMPTPSLWCVYCYETYVDKTKVPVK